MKVRDVVRLIEADGWRLDHQTGSHRQYRHPTKPGTVTVAGNQATTSKPAPWPACGVKQA
ncbi:MAG: type II toxin-antitoxin system HicA family toxin [Acidimicrobiia bacterium]